MNEKLQEATIKALQGKLLEDVEDIVTKKLNELNIDPSIFSEGQLNKIKEAIQSRLSDEALRVLCNPKFNHLQMKQIIKCFISRLTMDEILNIAKPEFHHDKMSGLRAGYEANLNTEEMNVLFSLPWVYESLTKEFVKAINKGISLDRLKLCFEDGFNIHKVVAYVKCFEQGMDINRFNIIEQADLHVTCFTNEIDIAREAVIKYNLNEEQLKLLVDWIEQDIVNTDRSEEVLKIAEDISNNIPIQDIIKKYELKIK